MRNYEGVFIINPDLNPDVVKNVVTQVQESVQKNGGRVEGVQDWGKRKLAYKINKKQEGYYCILNFQMESTASKKLEVALRLNDSLIRYMLINKDAL
jgi:small subunit ribosomal protein S6